MIPAIREHYPIPPNPHPVDRMNSLFPLILVLAVGNGFYLEQQPPERGEGGIAKNKALHHTSTRLLATSENRPPDRGEGRHFHQEVDM